MSNNEELSSIIRGQLEELQLIKCSLLPSEHLTFMQESEESSWSHALGTYIEDPTALRPSSPLNSPASFNIKVDDCRIWFQVKLCQPCSSISVKGENISRKEQEKWQTTVTKKLQEQKGDDFPIYQVISLHLLPLLHEELESRRDSGTVTSNSSTRTDSETFHVLFTSHHLISPKKRRSLQQWSNSLSLSGFAKVGYPGVIYAQGERCGIEEFVNNVKAMQWLALRLRFVEPVPSSPENEIRPIVRVKGDRCVTWKELQKVGDVIEEMRAIGMLEFVTGMGIGSSDDGSK